MQISTLSGTLEILKKGREKLISDVIYNKTYDIFKWLFLHEENIHGQKLGFDKYFLEWINSQLIEAFSVSNELGCIIVKLLSPIIEERAFIEREQTVIITKMVPQLLTEQIKILRTFMIVENLNEERLNEIKFEMDRDKAFFKRQLRQLEELNGIT